MIAEEYNHSERSDTNINHHSEAVPVLRQHHLLHDKRSSSFAHISCAHQFCNFATSAHITIISTAQPADEDIAEAAVSAVACEDIGKAVSVLRAYAGAESDATSILANACAGRFTAIMHALQKHRPGNPSMRASATPASKGQKRPAPVSASAASQDSTPSTAPPAAALPP